MTVNSGPIITDESLGGKAPRTRNNILKMGTILVPAVLMRIESARAGTPLSVVRANCFLKGTKIETASGECQVENLAIGDLLPTMFGGMRPVQWIGRHPSKKSDPAKPWVKEALPVRIARSALAPEVPHADLYVTAAHALYIDGLLVPAGCLVNGTTIKRDEARERDELEFFHISSKAMT